jgi:FKBP-type peptidyl-prolyl cis-trans isomerase
MKQLLTLGLIAVAGIAQAQSKDAFTTLPSSLEYRIVKDVAGTKKPVVGDFVEVHLVTKVEDSLLFDSRMMNNNSPVQFPLQAPAYKGDLVEGIMLMTPGDSAIFRISVDSVVKANNGQSFPWMKPNSKQKLVYMINLVSVKSKAEMEAEQKEKSAAQIKIDEKVINDYLNANKIKAQKTDNGLYYTITKEGTGAAAKSGQTVVVNYTGKLVDGEVFDSNVDPKFQHVQPFEFKLGQGQVIRGWDEGFMLMKKGSKGTLFIPSTMAYGANGQGPIKPNSVLIFDVEVTDIKDGDK